MIETNYCDMCLINTEHDFRYDDVRHNQRIKVCSVCGTYKFLDLPKGEK